MCGYVEVFNYQNCIFSGGRCVNEDGSNNCVKRSENIKTSFELPAADTDIDNNPPIWLDDLFCTGEESDITECRHNAWGTTDCGHKEDAGCICILRPTSSPVRGYSIICLTDDSTIDI